MAWIRHIYEQMRPAWEAQQLTLPDFDAFWGARPWRCPSRRATCCSSVRADPQAHPLLGQAGLLARLAGFGCHARRIRPGCRRREWLGAEAAREWPLHLDLPAGGPAALTGPVERRAQAEIAGRDRSACIRPAPATRHRPGDVVRLYNGTRRLPGRRRPGRGVARGGGHGHGRLVRPARRGWSAGNPNVLTRDEGTSRLAQGCSALSALVQAEKWAGGPEPVRVFEPPALATGGLNRRAAARLREGGDRKPRPGRSPNVTPGGG